MLTLGAVFGRSDESFVGQSRGIVYYAGKRLEHVINAKVWFLGTRRVSPFHSRSILSEMFCCWAVWVGR